ncbi:MAG TPA: YwiC-like family protein [Candidatus Kapabacteria bacterium]|jgi:hypothetical protein|nr:YwiC-like family protein [Candidatus Kapabacteria bacterium]
MAAVKRLFPREHGAYAVLVASWCCGVALARDITIGSIAALFAGLALFIAQEPMKAMLRASRTKGAGTSAQTAIRQFALLVTLGVLLLSVLAIGSPRILATLPLAALIGYVNFFLYRRRAPLVLQSIAGFGLLSLLAPLVYLQHPEASVWKGAQIWIELALFFTAAALTVGVRLKASSRAYCLRYYAISLPLVAIAFALGCYSFAGMLALSLSAGRFIWISTNLSAYLNFSLKRIGIHETIVTVALVVIYFLIP